MKQPRVLARLRNLKRERGQVLVLFIGVISMLFIACAMAINYGLWLSERRGIVRAADLGALAGSQDLPAGATWPGPMNSRAVCDAPAALPPNPPPGYVPPDACIAAFEWADRNGYTDDDEGGDTSVDVSFFCGNQLEEVVVNRINSANSTQKVCLNENCQTPGSQLCQDFPLSPCPSPGLEGVEKGCDAMSVTLNKDVLNVFPSFFPGVDLDIEVGFGSWSNVTFRLIPTDSVATIDRSGSMAFGCTGGVGGPQNDASGCPIKEARDAANNFVDYLVNGSNITKIAYNPYTGCYRPPGNDANCVPAMPIDGGNCDTPPASSQITCLNVNPFYAHQKINQTMAQGYTNLCLGLFEAMALLDGPQSQAGNPETKRFQVLLSDGDNFYNADAYNAPPPNTNPPPAACTPTTPNQDLAGGSCSNGPPGVNEQSLDIKTAQFAQTMKADAENVEIYVIGLSVCDADDLIMDTGDCDAIGVDNAGDGVADQRLLKCVASSTPGTNDHYFPTNDANDLGDIFQLVAFEIAARGLTTGAAPPP